MLSARSHEQIWIGHVGKTHLSGDNLLVDLSRGKLTGLYATRDFPTCLGYLPVTTVGQGHNQRHPLISPGRLDCFIQLTPASGRNLGDIAHDLQSDIVFHEGLFLLANGMDQKVHQCIDLLIRPVPVLRTERIERNVADAKLSTCLDDVTNRLDPLMVPDDPLLPALASPPAVTIHDKRNVRGEIALFLEKFLRLPILHRLLLTGYCCL